MSPSPRRLLSALAFSVAPFVLASCGSTTRPPITGPSGSPGAQTTAATGPLLGAWWDPQAAGLRLVYGVPGAAVEGPAIDNDGTYSGASACVRGRIAVLTTSAGGLFLGALPQGLPSSLTIEKISKPQIVFSPSCTAALAFSSDGSGGMLLQGLLSRTRCQPHLVSEPISAAAVADDGSLLTASQSANGTATVQFLTAGSSTARPVTTLSKLGALAFLPGAESAMLADAGANTVIEASQLSGNMNLVSVAGPSDGVAHPFAIGTSADGHWAVVANQGSTTLVRIDLSGQSAAARTICRCLPTMLEPLAGNLAFRVSPPGVGTVWAYDGSGSLPRLAFLPADDVNATDSSGSAAMMRSMVRGVVLSGCVLLLALAASGQKSASSTTITSNSQYLQLPGSVQLSSTVNPGQGTAGVPTGSVQFFYDGTNSLGTAPLTPISATEGFPLPPTTINVGNGPYGIFTLPGAAGQPATLGILDWYATPTPVVSYLPELTIYSGRGANLYQSAATYQITNSGLTGYTPGVNGYLVADFNHDGAPDVLLYGYSTTGIPGFAGNEFYVLPGNSAGVFNPAASVISADQSGITCDCNYPSAALATDDFNGDGYPDVAYAANGAYSNDLVGVALNGGAAAPASFKTFVAAPAPVVAGDTFQTLVIASGHFTASGHADLVVAGRLLDGEGAVVDAGDTAVYLGNGDGTFGTPAIVSEGTNPIAIQTADLRKTGLSDVVVANQGADNAPESIVVLFNDGQGNLTVASTVLPPITPAAIAIADMNADGYPDILSTGVDGSLALLLNDGTGHFAAVTTLTGTTSVPSISAIGDFNADGLPDIARTTTEPVYPNNNATAYALINSASAQAALTTAPQTLPVGMHTLTASFPSDANFNASTSQGVIITVTQTVPTIRGRRRPPCNTGHRWELRN